MLFLVIILFNIFLYYRTISFGLSTDDEEWYARIKENGFRPFNKIRTFDHLRSFIQERFYGGTTFGTNLKIEHAFTLFLYTLSSCLVYIAFGYNYVSFYTAILYSVNPINHSTSIWLNGRRYLVNIILVLLMMIVWKYGYLGKGFTYFLYLLTGIFHLTALFSPLLLGYGNLFLIAGIYLLYGERISLTIKRRSEVIAESDMKHFSPKRLIIIIKSYGFYFWRILIPGICGLIYPKLFYWEKTKEGNENAYSFNFDFWRGLGGIALTSFLIYLVPAPQKSWILFMGLGILQWCNIIPILQTLADRYCSLAVPFLMFFLSYFLSFTGIFYIPIVILIVTYYYLGLYVVLPMYKNIVTFYEYHIKFFPTIPVPRLAYIECLMLQGRIKEAEGLVRDGLMANPKDFELLRFGALFLLFKQAKRQGLALCTEAEKNFYIGQEVEQARVINNLKDLLNKIN